MTKKYHPYLRSIQFGNVRCFASEQRLDFTNSNGNPSHFTLFLGENGCGKTTLLQLLALLRPDDEHFMKRYDKEGYRVAWTQVTGADAMRLTHLPRVGHNTDVSVSFRCSSGLSEPAQFDLDFKVNIRTYGASVRESPELSESERFQTLTVGYGPLRHSVSAAVSAQLSFDSVEGLFSAQTPISSPEEWFFQYEYLANNRRISKAARFAAGERRDRVAALLKALLPGVMDLVPGTSTEYGKQSLVLFAVTPYGKVPVSRLGFGYQTTLAWVVDLAARMMVAYPESDDPLAEPAVVLIDEIDLHLHPKWQRTLLTELSQRFPNVQFIATAHSPLIVQAAPDANVAVFRREGDHVVIDQSLPSVRHWRVDQILTSDLFRLPSARDPSLDDKLGERDRLLAKPSLTERDEARLAELRDELGDLPGGQTKWEMEAMEVIQRAAKSLANKGVRDEVTPAKKKPAAKGAVTKGAKAKAPRSKK